MAISTPTGFDQSTKNDPKNIRIDPRTLVLENAFRGRWAPDGELPIDQDYLRELAMSMIETGQEQPIIIREVSGRGETRKYSPVFGFNRTQAAILINEDETLLALAGEYNRLNKTGIFLLDAIIHRMNKEEAIVHNIAENKIRKGTSPIDDAHNLVILRDMGKTNNEAARILGMNPQAASVIIPLVQLEDRFKAKVHNGELTVKAALNLLSLPENDRDAVFKELDEEDEEEANTTVEAGHTSEDSDIENTSNITNESKVKDSDNSANANTTIAKPKAKAAKAPKPRKQPKKDKISDKIKEKQREQGMRVKPTLKEVRILFLEQLNENIYHGDDDIAIKHLFQTLVEYINGDADGDQTITAIVDLMSN